MHTSIFTQILELGSLVATPESFSHFGLALIFKERCSIESMFPLTDSFISNRYLRVERYSEASIGVFLRAESLTQTLTTLMSPVIFPNSTVEVMHLVIHQRNTEQTPYSIFFGMLRAVGKPRVLKKHLKTLKSSKFVIQSILPLEPLANKTEVGADSPCRIGHCYLQ